MQEVTPLWLDHDTRHTGQQAAASFCDEFWNFPRKILAWSGAAFRIKEGGWYRVKMHDGHWAIFKSAAPIVQKGAS